MTELLEPRLPHRFVVCWISGGERRFVSSERWGELAGVFEDRLRELVPGRPVERLKRDVAALSVDLGGIRHSSSSPVGAYRAAVPEGTREFETFACLGPKPVPVLGDRQTIAPFLERFQSGASRGGVELFEPGEAGGPFEVPHEANYSERARFALRRSLRREFLAAAFEGLTKGELIWAGTEARRQGNPQLTVRIAELAFVRNPTSGSLNLKGQALRDLDELDASLDAYERSIELEQEAENNPYGYVGRAATLRRLGRLDEAYDDVKRVIRFYPRDDYALSTRDAILRKLGPEPPGSRSAA